MKRVAILVGHQGRGTGANLGGRDEWALCRQDAEALTNRLQEDGVLEGVVIGVNVDTWPWKAVRRVSKGLFFRNWWTNVDLRLEGVRELGPFHAAIELHLNRYKLNTLGVRKAVGMEVFIRRNPGPKTRRLGKSLHRALATHVHHKDRGLKEKSFRVLQGLHRENIPGALIEPAFLAEDRVVSDQWRETYVRALIEGLYGYFGG